MKANTIKKIFSYTFPKSMLFIPLFLITIHAHIWAESNDFYTLEFQPGTGDSKLILIGLSADENYFSYIEIYSPYQKFSKQYRAFGKFVIINVIQNNCPVKSLQASIEIFNNPLDQDCFSFFEYNLLLTLMKNAQPLLNTYGIIPGVLPIRAIPFQNANADTSKAQSFHLFNGEMGELAQVVLEIIKQPSSSALDIRLRSKGAKTMEKILLKDKKVPKWRILAKDYSIDRVYFYGNYKKYIIVFVKIIFKPEKGTEEKRYMCVTGEISEIWENAFKWSEEEIFK